MKNIGRMFPAAGALALLTAAAPFASAQAVGGFLRPGGISRSTQSSPAPSQPPNQPSQPMPMGPGAVFARPAPSFGPSGGYNQPTFNRPTYNQPTFNRPVFSPPTDRSPNYGNGQVYSSSPVYGSAPVYGSTQGYGNGPIFRSERPSGPVVVIPDAAEQRSGIRYRRPRPTVPVDPANGFSTNGTLGGTDLRITTPGGWRRVPPTVYRNTYVYNNYNSAPIVVNAPPLLGGYYYGNYCDTYTQAGTYPSVYSVYDGFPQYIFNATPNVIVVGQPYYPPYVTTYLPFYTPSYPVTYNQNNYYVTNESRAQEIQAGGDRAREAIKNAYPADSYQAAFGDIARAWTDGDIKPLHKHIRDSDTRISVFLNKKYSYSIASGDFEQITRDALDRLHTVSFDFTRLRKAKNGDVTAYGTHVYRTGDSQGSRDGDTVPFDQSGASPEATSPYDKAGDPAAGMEKTVYVSYTLRHRDGQWYIVEVDSADHDLVPEQ